MSERKLVKGKIWTGNPSMKWAEAFFTEGGVIKSVGSYSEVKAFANGHEYDTLDYQDNLIIPGMTDAHIHATAYAKQDLYVNLSAVTSLYEARTLILARAKNTPAGQWIRAINFNEAAWDNAIKPDIEFMDSLGLDNPVIMSRYCGHFHAVNTRALKESGLFDVYDVNVVRNKEGEHRGQLTEGAAGKIIETVASIYEKPESIKELIEKSCLKLSSLGITAVHACDAPSYALGEDLASCQTLDEEGRLSVRWACYHDKLPSYCIKSGFGNDMVFFAGFKMFADGTLGGRTCGMLEGFNDDPENCGLLNHTADELFAQIGEATKRGIQVQIHAIGDKALQETINCMSRVIETYGKPELPFRINHAIVASPKLIEEMKKIDAIVDMQPIQAHTDRKMAPLRVGEERLKYCYAFRDMFDAGLTVTGSSDAPIEDPNPWLGIWAAVTLSEFDGTPLAGFDRRQRLTLEEALSMYTVNPWKALGREEFAGSLSLGKHADFTVVDGNPFEMDVQELRNVKHLATSLNGKLVWNL